MIDDRDFEAAPHTGSIPTDAHLAMNALLARVLLEVAQRCQDRTPGLVETLQDDVLLNIGGTSLHVHGWFAKDVWRLEDRHVHELFLNGDRRAERSASVTVAEDVLVTLSHEAGHAYAQAQGIQDTSRDGRYHNRRFAEIALQIGLEIEKDPVIGHRTPCLSAWGRVEYADLLIELERGLVLAREPRLRGRSSGNGDVDDHLGDQVATTGPAVTSSKYVFASCQCLAGRGRRVTIRVAAGSWRAGAIQCGVCSAAFAESLTGGRQ